MKIKTFKTLTKFDKLTTLLLTILITLLITGNNVYSQEIEFKKSSIRRWCIQIVV